jgi:hypothetical protein
VLFGGIAIFRTSKNSKNQQKEFFLEKASKALNNYLISTTENDGLQQNSVDDFQLKRINRVLFSDQRKDYFIDHLLSLKRALFGEMDEALDHAYTYLGLEKYSLKKTKSWKYSRRIKGFQELSLFRSKLGLSPILKQVNSSQRFLRQESQVALVKLSTKNPLSFLNKLMFNISDWQKLQLHTELNTTEFKYESKFEKYLGSELPSIRSFIITLCTLFKRIESIAIIRELLENENNESVVIAGIIALGEMGDDRDIALTKTLMQKFEAKSVTIQGLKTLGAIENPEDLDFIKTYLAHPNLEVQLHAMYALNEITFEVGHYLTQQAVLLTAEQQQMVDHIEEPLNS